MIPFSDQGKSDCELKMKRPFHLEGPFLLSEFYLTATVMVTEVVPEE